MKFKENHCYMNNEETIAYHGAPYYAYGIEYEDGVVIHTHSKKELTKEEIENLHQIRKVLE